MQPYGFLTQIINAAVAVPYWTANDANAHGRLTSETFGNGLTSLRVYDHVSDDLQSIQTGTSASPASIQNLSYSFDVLGNLKTRTDAIQNFTETFGYDEDGRSLNRLTSVTGSSPKTFQYAVNGNLLSKSDVGTYIYSTNGIRPHAVSSVSGALNASYTYDANGNQLSGNGRTLTYTSFNKPKTIDNGDITTFTYDANFNRIVKANGNGSTIYIGRRYERFDSGGGIVQRHFIYAGNNLIALYTQNSNNTGNTRYFHTDHLGSVDTLTSETGTVTVRYSYDAHGRRRLASGAEVGIGFNLTGGRRGYTGHEHDDEVGLINMNAREYDYVLGRFITPDTIVPGTLNSQSYNRYSYVNNNPLSLTDPSGHSWLSKGLRRATQSVRSAVHNAGESIGRALTNVATNLSQVKYVGGLLTTGFLANPTFGPLYGATTSDWNSVGRATANAGAMAATIWLGGEYGATGRMFGSGINGYLQTGNSEGFLRGFTAGAIPQDLGFTDAYRTSALANIGIGIGRDALRGYVVGGRDGIVPGIEYGQFNNAVGHLVGFASTQSGPTFKDGAFYYRGSAWNGAGAITFGNVISAGNAGQFDPFNNNNLLLHEGGHVPQATALGAAYIPAHILTAGYSLTVNSGALISDVQSGAYQLNGGLGYYTHLSNPLESQPFVPVNWNNVYK